MVRSRIPMSVFLFSVVAFLLANILYARPEVEQAAAHRTDLLSALSPSVRFEQESAVQQTTAPYTVFLPLVQSPAAPPIFGMEPDLGWLSNATVRARAAELGATWVRINGVLWHQVQPNQNGAYNWSALASLDRDIEAAHAIGLIPTVIIRGAPPWAARVPTSLCSAVREEHFQAYAAFLEALAARYRDRVVYWELGNEPDVDPGLIPSNFPFGCWGDISDPYYGGEHFGRMLQVATPALRRGNPQAKIIFGGLLLDSSNTPVYGDNPTLGTPERFLEGALRAGAGNSFDILAYHAYPSLTPGIVEDVDLDLNHGRGWNELGGTVIGKANFLRQVMQQYGVSKPIWLNETSLIAPNTTDPWYQPPDQQFFDRQANHLVRTLSRAAANDIQMYSWYTFQGSGWRDGGLLDAQQQPRPSFIAYKHMIATVAPYRRVFAVNYGPEFEAYRYEQGSMVVDVIWRRSYDGGSKRQVRGPKGGFIRATAVDGSNLTPQYTTNEWIVDVGFSPVLIEHRP